MGLYTRAQYEADCKMIDEKIAKSASLLADQAIGPLTHWQYAKAMDEIKRKLGVRLTMTALSIVDKRRTGKSRYFAWVIGIKKDHERGCPRLEKKYYCTCTGLWYVSRKSRDPLLKHTELTQGRWRPTDLAEVDALESQGITVIEAFFGQKSKSSQEPNPDDYVFEEFDWKEISKEEVPKYADAGLWLDCHAGTCLHKVICPIKGERWFRASFMVKEEGDLNKGQEVKYYVVSLGQEEVCEKVACLTK